MSGSEMAGMDDAAALAERTASGALPRSERPARKDFLVGTVAALATVTIWGGWVVVTRLGVTATLAPSDVAFLRFSIAGIVLLPVLWRHGFAWRRIGLAKSLVMATGAGAPFFLVSSAGMQFAPAAHVGALLPGTMPLFVALLSALLNHERYGPWRSAGFGLIVAGVLAIGGYSLFAAAGEWRGHLLFLLGASLWAGYTLALRRAGIGAWHATALVNFYSMAGFAPLYWLLLEPRLLAASWQEVALQAGCQGVLSGIVAMFAYAVAVSRLGPTRAAAFSALTPAIAALLAVLILGEIPDPATIVGIVAVSLGVALASGALGRRTAPA